VAEVSKKWLRLRLLCHGVSITQTVAHQATRSRPIIIGDASWLASTSVTNRIDHYERINACLFALFMECSHSGYFI
jgi:hypothetical protein